MTAPETPLWRVAIGPTAHGLDALEAAVSDQAEVVVTHVADGAGVLIEGFARKPPDRAALALAVALVAAASGASPAALSVAQAPRRDWLALNREAFLPFRIGRFEVSDSEHAPANSGGGRATLPLIVDAGAAFGSGRHASTAGCLLALQALRADRVASALDLGTGSGALAFAIAKLWTSAVVTATDIDPRAVAIAREGARRNGVAGRLLLAVGDGTAHPAIRAAAPFDLIAANILARPLKALASGLARLAAPTATVVLGGFLVRDARDVEAFWRAFGFRRRAAIARDGWSTLILRRRQRPALRDVL